MNHTSHDHETAPVLPSVLFWICLFSAIGLFAAVFLSPKLLAVHRLSAQRLQLAQHLAHLKDRNAFLDRVSHALENDPEFTAEIARFETNAGSADERHLAVSPVLPGAGGGTRQASRAAPVTGWLPLLHRLAEDKLASNLCLLMSGGLVVVAFTFFNPIHPADHSSSPSARRNVKA